MEATVPLHMDFASRIPMYCLTLCGVQYSESFIY